MIKNIHVFYFPLIGLQIWQDGGQYEGEFLLDMRHGEGELRWSNGEVRFLKILCLLKA